MLTSKYKYNISLYDFSTKLKSLKSNNNKRLNEEFQTLTIEAKFNEEKLGLTFNVGNNSQNSAKNRYSSIVPFDQNRVIIHGKSFHDNYINASLIPFEGLEDQYEFIASQGPVDDTVNEFWTMIMEQNISCIVMLTRLTEGNYSKCVKYWPDSIGTTTYYGDNNEISVSLINETERKSHVERKFLVHTKKLIEPKTIIQLHMHTWDDQCDPSIEGLDQILKEYLKLRRKMKNSLDLIHCSAGVGRTGTFLCIFKILKQLINGIEIINIYETVLKLRQYRAFLVEQESLYIFIYDYINHFIRKYVKLNDSNKAEICFREDLDLLEDMFTLKE